MKISIVTISFNQAEFLEKTISSVLAQKKDLDVEYIVVDPGSTDGSREIIEKYRDRIQHIIYEKDDGPADGLNKGFSYAIGNILGYLNSDDLLLPEALKSVHNYFSKNEYIDIIYGHGQVIDAQGTIIRKCFSDRFQLCAAAYGAAVVIQPSMFFRRSVFEKVGGFNVENKSNWDGELLIDMSIAGANLKRVDKFYSAYRIHDQGITGTGKLAVLHRDHRKRMFEKIIGREFKQVDSYIGLLFRMRKHLMHPISTWERLRYGPIFGREA